MVSALIQELESTAAILTGKKNVVDIENKSLCGSIRKLRSYRIKKLKGYVWTDSLSKKR